MPLALAPSPTALTVTLTPAPTPTLTLPLPLPLPLPPTLTQVTSYIRVVDYIVLSTLHALLMSSLDDLLCMFKNVPLGYKVPLPLTPTLPLTLTRCGGIPGHYCHDTSGQSGFFPCDKHIPATWGTGVQCLESSCACSSTCRCGHSKEYSNSEQYSHSK